MIQIKLLNLDQNAAKGGHVLFRNTRFYECFLLIVRHRMPKCYSFFHVVIFRAFWIRLVNLWQLCLDEDIIRCRLALRRCFRRFRWQGAKRGNQPCFFTEAVPVLGCIFFLVNFKQLSRCSPSSRAALIVARASLARRSLPRPNSQASKATLSDRIATRVSCGSMLQFDSLATRASTSPCMIASLYNVYV